MGLIPLYSTSWPRSADKHLFLYVYINRIEIKIRIKQEISSVDEEGQSVYWVSKMSSRADDQWIQYACKKLKECKKIDKEGSTSMCNRSSKAGKDNE